jgi:hypothetical protein
MSAQLTVKSASTDNLKKLRDRAIFVEREHLILGALIKLEQ